MKINVEVDCTPDEARQFFGLPDVKPIQAAVMARIEQQMLEAASATSPDALLKTWLPAMGQASEQFQKMMAGFLAGNLGGAAGGKP